MPELMPIELWIRDLVALHDDLRIARARVELLVERLPELDDSQKSALKRLMASIDAPICHIEARVTTDRIYD